MKKIVYIGMKNDYGDEKRPKAYDYVHIYQTLQKSGYDCDFFDYMALLKSKSSTELQSALLEFIKDKKTDLVIFSLYRDEISVETIEAITKLTKTFGIFFDDTWRRGFVVKYGSCMNYFTTTDPYGETIYKQMGLKSKALYFSYGFNPEYFFADRSSLTHDVSFVGSWSPSREWVIKHLSKAGIKVEVFGHGWKNGILTHEQMVEVFQKSKISLNLSNSVQNSLSYALSSPRALKNYLTGVKKGEQLKGRHVEINACGGFQISFYADGLAGLYQIGNEIEVYQSVDDLIFKLKFFLENETERETIGKQGLLRSQNYKYAQVMSDLFKRMGF